MGPAAGSSLLSCDTRTSRGVSLELSGERSPRLFGVTILGKGGSASVVSIDKVLRPAGSGWPWGVAASWTLL